MSSLTSKKENKPNNNLVAVQSGTNVGSMRYLQHLAYNERKKGLNCLFISNETPSIHLHTMQIAKHMFTTNPETALSDYAILHKHYDLDQAIILNEAMLDMDRLGFGEFVADYQENITLDNLEEILNMVWEEGFHFDVVVIDGLSCVPKKYTQNQVFAITDQLAKTFKGVGFKPIISVMMNKNHVNDTEEVNKVSRLEYTQIHLERLECGNLKVSKSSLTPNEVNHNVELFKPIFKHCCFE